MQRETGLCVCLYILTEAFVRPYDAGLVYRKEALVNWCCSLQSAILDIEVDHLHLTGPTELAVPGYSKPVSFGKMWDFPYRLADSGSFGARSRHRRRPRLCRAAVSTWCHSCTGGLGIAGWTTSQTGVSPGSSGGAAECQCTTLLQQMARRCGWRLLGGGCKAEGCGEGRRKIWTSVSPLASPFASLGWPGQGRGETMPDLARFYATTLKTGHGILLWVAQVVMPGLDLTGRLSFETVLLHGLQGDGGGHKTSKSWGSVINPLDVISGASLEVCDLPVLCVLYWCSLAVVSSTLTAGIPECGADALWSTLCSTSFRSQCGIDICG
ncbi:valine--tRNA ligase, mitochondrial-like isoform X4 [Scylla paramamosain]|uniref:valine--tRNA ligase, mitochondrial-like isoform X4 n=1 Tax=Scylla paramamosain TaxID=85552 RepID=UPI003083B5F0